MKADLEDMKEKFTDYIPLQEVLSSDRINIQGQLKMPEGSK